MAKRPHGRPTAGIKAGEKVSDYKIFSLRLPPEAQALLHAVGEVQGIAGWRVLMSALQNYVRALPAADRRLVQELAQRRTERSQGRAVR
jgi:hypothetical protein